MPAIDNDIIESYVEYKPYSRRSVLVSPDFRFSPAGSRWGSMAVEQGQLRQLARKSPTVAAIVNLRVNQLMDFARIPRHKGDRGFEIIRADDPATKKDHDKRITEDVVNFFLHTGWKEDPERKDSFGDFLGKLVRDRYVLGTPAFEIVYDETGRPSEIWAIDGATIEIQLSERYIPTTRYGKEMHQRVAYVQVVDGQITTEYAEDEMVFRPALPDSMLNSGGYGIGELTACLDCVAAEVLALQYNSNYFDQGSVPPGILAIIGNFSEESLQGLNELWNTDATGIVGQHKPIAIAMDQGQMVNWIPMKQSNRDMEMGDFWDKIRTSICSVFGVDPVELGQRSAISTGAMTSSDNTVAKIDLSKDKGLIPLLQWFETTFNDYVMPRLAPGYLFRWVGIETEDETKKIDYLNKQMREGALTPREWRRAMGLSEVPPNFDHENEVILDLFLNPQAIQVWSTLKQEKQQQQMMQQQQAQQGAMAQGGGQPGAQGAPGAQGEPAGQEEAQPEVVGTNEPRSDLEENDEEEKSLTGEQNKNHRPLLYA